MPGVALRAETLALVEATARIGIMISTRHTVRGIARGPSEAKVLDWCEKSAELLEHSKDDRPRHPAQLLRSTAATIRDALDVG